MCLEKNQEFTRVLHSARLCATSRRERRRESVKETIVSDSLTQQLVFLSAYFPWQIVASVRKVKNKIIFQAPGTRVATVSVCKTRLPVCGIARCVATTGTASLKMKQKQGGQRTLVKERAENLIASGQDCLRDTKRIAKSLPPMLSPVKVRWTRKATTWSATKTHSLRT